MNRPRYFHDESGARIDEAAKKRARLPFEASPFDASADAQA
ncbi:MAG: hypothetical protein AVDCRST_MAG91-1955 [uncultured Sphingomonadaceae bacterium]|uniref:Uncharacterized protein n=1 Tax=uncultured Sphingomonadaceae bacterium TaxID=169976 RepID=A0A6J4T9D2_9SPHN|nr:MAG: hypothetical protein AVDCRST_MAG91-1955 [uncultured Sphingomonadaceae bacterium]